MVGRCRQQAGKFVYLHRPADRDAVIDLDARNVRRARDLAPAPGALESGLADAQDALDIGRGESLLDQMGDKAFKLRRSGRLGDARLAEEFDPIGAGGFDAAGAARLAAMVLVIVEENIGERNGLGRRVLRTVLLKIAF